MNFARSFAFASGGLLITACTHCNRGSDGSDPTLDAATNGSGEAGRTPDGGDEAGPVDGWRHVSGMSSACQVQYAVDPHSALPALAWIPCINGASGCKEMKTGWRTDGVPDNFTTAFVAGTTAHHFFQPTLRRSRSLFESDVYDLETLEPLAGWRSETSTTDCVAFPVVGPNTAIVIGSDFTQKPLPQRAFAFGSASAVAQMTLNPLPPGIETASELLQDTAASDTTFAFDLVTKGSIARIDLSSGASAKTATTEPLIAPTVYQTDVYAWSQHGTDGWAREMKIDPSGSVTVMRAVPSRHIMDFATDGATIAWIESYGGAASSYSQPNVEVWASTYSADPVAVATAARKVTTLSSGEVLGGVVFNGYFAFGQSDETRATVVRLSDGAQQTVAPGSGRGFFSLPYVSATELWAVLVNAGTVTEPAVARFQLSTWP